jgi:CRP-like cAMP-binding protein
MAITATLLRAKHANRLLADMDPEDLARIEPHLRHVDLPVTTDLEKAGQKVEYLYFLERGIASVVASNAKGRQIEIGLIGREGVTGFPILLGDSVSSHSTYMQIGGAGHKVPASVISDALKYSPRLREQLARFAHTLMIQTAHTALANGRANILERLSRWILMAHDRVEGNVLPITHVFLSLMLGVRRAGVTLALHELEGRKLIRATRGQITVLDRAGIEQMTNGFYGQPELEYARLHPIQPKESAVVPADAFDLP